MASKEGATVNDTLLKSIKQESQEWAACHGLVMYSKKTQLQHAPFTLLPSPIPKKLFSLAQELAPLFNELYHAISLDTQWLLRTLAM